MILFFYSQESHWSTQKAAVRGLGERKAVLLCWEGKWKMVQVHQFMSTRPFTGEKGRWESLRNVGVKGGLSQRERGKGFALKTKWEGLTAAPQRKPGNQEKDRGCGVK